MNAFHEGGLHELSVAPTNPPTLYLVKDIDQDGTPDIVTWSNQTRLFQYYPGHGIFGFGPLTTLNSSYDPGLFSDVDGDGYLDLVVSQPGLNLIRILWGHGQAVFGPEEEDVGLDTGATAFVTDVNGDGSPDLYLYNNTSLFVLPQYQSPVAAKSGPPARVMLSATPNPARGPVSLGYSMPRAGSVQLGMYDLHGRLVKELFSGTKAPGAYRLSWDGRDASGMRAPAGVYFARGTFDGLRTVTKIVVMN